MNASMAPREPSPPTPHHHRVRDVSRSTSHKSDSLNAPSVSQSNEADDERSLSAGGCYSGDSDEEDEDYLSMGPDDGGSTVDGEVGRQRYEGEDVRMTGRNELRGFFCYGWAAEVGWLFFSFVYSDCEME